MLRGPISDTSDQKPQAAGRTWPKPSPTVLNVKPRKQVQILRYRLGEFYAAHTDNFDPQYYQNSVEARMPAPFAETCPNAACG